MCVNGSHCYEKLKKYSEISCLDVCSFTSANKAYSKEVGQELSIIIKGILLDTIIYAMFSLELLLFSALENWVIAEMCSKCDC